MSSDLVNSFEGLVPNFSWKYLLVGCANFVFAKNLK